MFSHHVARTDRQPLSASFAHFMPDRHVSMLATPIVTVTTLFLKAAQTHKEAPWAKLTFGRTGSLARLDLLSSLTQAFSWACDRCMRILKSMCKLDPFVGGRKPCALGIGGGVTRHWQGFGEQRG